MYDDAKHTVHGTNYGMGPRLMSDMYEMPEAEAKRLQSLYFDLFPKIRQWQRATLDRAAKECKLRNPFGYEMSFWEVQRWDSKYKRWTLGEDAKSAIAFLPRDTAAAMLKEVLLRLQAAGGGRRAARVDTRLPHVRDRQRTGCKRSRACSSMRWTRPVPELCHLSIGVEVKAGVAWHDSAMETLDLDEAIVTTA